MLADKFDNLLLVIEDFLGLDSLEPSLFDSKKFLFHAPLPASSRQTYQSPLALIDLEPR
jgi:hypothetical protein